MPDSLLCASRDYRTSLCVETWFLQSNSIFRHLKMLSLKSIRWHIILSMVRFWFFSHLSFILSWLFISSSFFSSHFTFTEEQLHICRTPATSLHTEVAAGGFTTKWGGNFLMSNRLVGEAPGASQDERGLSVCAALLHSSSWRKHSFPPGALLQSTLPEHS